MLDSQKTRYFDEEVDLSQSSIVAHLEHPTIDKLLLQFSREVIEDTVCTLTFDEPMCGSLPQALREFKLDEANGVYTVDITNRVRFNLVIGFLRDGFTFRGIEKCCNTIRETLRHSKIVGVSHGLVGFHARICLCLSLQGI